MLRVVASTGAVRPDGVLASRIEILSTSMCASDLYLRSSRSAISLNLVLVREGGCESHPVAF